MLQFRKTYIFAVFVAGLFAAGLTLPAHPAPQVKIMPGSAVRGQGVLESKACLSCHSLNGRGGSRAPDFAEVSGRDRRPSRLAVAMWNHMPAMWADHEAMQREILPMTSFEAADLFAYFYATLYFAPRGNAARGKSVFEEKNCVSCHGEILDPRNVSPLRPSWTDVADPIAFAEGMWNHASEMDGATSNRGVRWPTLSERDIVDLVTFLSKLPAANAEAADFSVGEPERGRVVFERSCESCHEFGYKDNSKIDLLRKSSPASVMEYVAAMWNHAPMMRRQGGSTSMLNPGEMGDLIAFLFAQQFFFEIGNPARGRIVYEAKRCSGCHDHYKTSGAPDLSQAAETYSPITLTSAVWQHGPSMLGAMKQQGIRWPQFQDSEMTNLIAYLNSRLIPRIAGETVQPDRN